MIDLEEKDKRIVEKILMDNLSDCQVRVFGSRIKGEAKKIF